MNVENLVNRPLSSKGEARLLKMYQESNLSPDEGYTYPGHMITLSRRYFTEYDKVRHKHIVSEKGINYLKSKNLI